MDIIFLPCLSLIRRFRPIWCYTSYPILHFEFHILAACAAMPDTHGNANRLANTQSKNTCIIECHYTTPIPPQVEAKRTSTAAVLATNPPLSFVETGKKRWAERQQFTCTIRRHLQPPCLILLCLHMECV